MGLTKVYANIVTLHGINLMAAGHYQSNDGGGRVHPLSHLVSGLVNAWSQGLEAFLEMAGLTTADTNERADTLATSIIERLQESAKFFETILPGGAELSEATKPGQVALARALELSPAVAQAYAVCTGSMIRYCGTLAELFVRHEANLLKAAADRVTGNNPAPVTECRVVADDLRGFLREVGEAAMGEARRLEDNLATVGESVARATDRATPSPHPNQDRRRYEVKP